MDDRLLRLEEVKRITGLSRSSIYRKMEEGTFPRSVRVTSSSVRWRRSDIDDWMESLPVTGEGSEGRGTSVGDGKRPWRGRPKKQRGVRPARIASRGLSSPPKRGNPGAASPDHIRTTPRQIHRAGAGSGRGARRRPRRILIPAASTHAGMLPVPDQPGRSAWPATGSDDALVRLREIVRP